MKIAYLLSHDITKNDGITKKILGQISEWEKQGNEIEIYCFVPNKGESILSDAKQFVFKNAFTLRLKLNKKLLEDIENFKPDILYFRYDTWSRSLSKLLKKYKVIVELNTFDLGEFWLLLKEQKTIKSLFRYLAYRFLRGRVLSKVAGIVAVTKEIAEHSSNAKYNKPTIYIPNGIDLENYKTIKSLNNQAKRIGLFFIGTPNQPWHGVDIIEEMAKLMPEFDFHIVGMSGVSTENLFWHGYLQKEQYTEILKMCHFCIGSLALYRNGMQEACPLKVREYLAYGYPTIIGYLDTAFLHLDAPDWIQTIDTTKELDIDSINSFIIKNSNIVVGHNELVNVVATKILEEKRMKFFRRGIE